jgi:Mg-chelatase subunit ChlD
VPVDVVLAFDTSVSMREPTPSGGSNLEAAVAAGRAFIGLLGLPVDQAGVVAFHQVAEVVQPLTSDRVSLLTALARLPQGSGTRLDAGLAASTSELTGPLSKAGSLRAVVLLTDGRQSGGTGADVIAAADEARAHGVAVYAIGVGDGVDEALLRAAAGDPHRLFLAAGPQALEAIYRDIAGLLPCH